MNIVILHDFFAVRGGAESVVLTLFRGLKQQHSVTLVTGYVNKELFPELDNRSDVIQLGEMTTVTGWESLKMLWLFRFHTGFVENYDECIYSGIYATAAVIHRAGQHNYHYCHTPPRFVYDLRDYYRRKAKIWQRLPLSILRYLVGRSYRSSIGRMDRIYANSRNVKERLKSYLATDSQVVYPPVDTDFYHWLGQSDYYLSTARLEAYKQVDLIVAAFKQMPDKKLVIASSGREEKRLRNLAASCPNIRFTGWCSRQKIGELLGNCIATIYIPLDEDFGMSPVESMAAGKPVIGVNEGGLVESIIPGQTGLLLPSPVLPQDLVDAVSSLGDSQALAMRPACEARAERFSIESFLSNWD